MLSGLNHWLGNVSLPTVGVAGDRLAPGRAALTNATPLEHSGRAERRPRLLRFLTHIRHTAHDRRPETRVR